jgi:murein DD-endopeptidase MepM/ murein hydrolase activator NlpD
MTKNTKPQIRFPSKACIKAATKSVTSAKGITLKLGLTYLKNVLSQSPLEKAIIVRKKDNGTADGRYDESGGNRYRFVKLPDGSYTGKPHFGVDLVGKVGDAVYAVAGGTADLIEDKRNPKEGYGDYILINHGENLYTLYAHLSKFSINSRARIELVEGQPFKIGEIGRTGNPKGDPHLHFEVFSWKSNMKWSERVNYNPETIFNFSKEKEVEPKQ